MVWCSSAPLDPRTALSGCEQFRHARRGRTETMFDVRNYEIKRQWHLLVRFYRRIGQKEPRLDVLREYSRMKFRCPHSRVDFENSSIYWKPRCFICRVLGAHHRHHIVPLARGGINEQINVVSLCRTCHREVHRIGRANRQPVVGILRQPRTLGPPRLKKQVMHRTVDAGVFPVIEGDALTSHMALNAGQ